MKSGGIAGEKLRNFIERVERLEEEKAAISADIRDVFAQAKGDGFDIKTMRHLIKLRKMDHAEREEHEALIDIYKAALGMLDGTPLGEAAIRRLSGERKPEDEGAEDGRQDEMGSSPVDEAATPHDAGPTIEEAREMARQAASQGKPVTSNPFPARDPRRAAWDEEWCKAAGNDGMDLPEAWRRQPKKPDGQGDAASKGE